MSAGRMYDKIGEKARGVIKYVLQQGLLCEVVRDTEEEK